MNIFKTEKMSESNMTNNYQSYKYPQGTGFRKSALFKGEKKEITEIKVTQREKQQQQQQQQQQKTFKTKCFKCFYLDQLSNARRH